MEFDMVFNKANAPEASVNPGSAFTVGNSVPLSLKFREPIRTEGNVIG